MKKFFRKLSNSLDVEKLPRYDDGPDKNNFWREKFIHNFKGLLMITRTRAYNIVSHVQFKKMNYDDYIALWWKHADLSTLERLYECINPDFSLNVVKFIKEFPEEVENVDA